MRRPLVLSLSCLLCLASGCGEFSASEPPPPTGPVTGTGGHGTSGPQGPQGETGPAGPAGQYARIKIVSPGATPAEGGAHLRAALDSIVSASQESPWLLQLEPGVFDLGDAGLVLRPHVHLQGSGAALTTVRSHAITPTVTTVEHSELHALGVEHQGGTPEALALFIPSSGFRARDVRISAHDGQERTQALRITGSAVFSRASGAADAAQGEVRGMDCQECFVHATDSSFSASGGRQAVGVALLGGGLELWDSRAEGARGADESSGVDARGSAHVELARAEALAAEGKVTTGLRLSSSSASVRDSFLGATGTAAHETRALDVSRVARLTYAVDVERSTLVGTTQVVRGAEGYTIRLIGSQLRGGHVEGGGMVSCHGSYDENFTAPAAPACP